MFNKDKENGLKQAAIFTAGGVVTATGVIVKLGGMDLATAETTALIGAATIVAAGAVVGLSAYGFKSILVKT
ncbi:MAG: hypothetical protein AAFX46_07580 [Cyanobacteria bacterium J06636_27]